MKVTVYSTSTCIFCAMLKKWLDSKDVEYIERVVDKDPGAAEEMAKVSDYQATPFTTVEYSDGTLEGIVGFDRPKIEAALNKG